MVSVGPSCGWNAASGGCGPTTIVITLPPGIAPADSFAPPSGATSHVVTEGDGSTTVTLTYAMFTSDNNTTFQLPVQVAETLPYSDNGTSVTFTAVMTTTTEPDDPLHTTTSVTLSVPQAAAITPDVATWTCDTPSDDCENVTGAGPILVDKSGSAVTYTTGATNHSNLASPMKFVMPSMVYPGDGDIDVMDMFNVAWLAFSENPAGATITFTMPDWDNPRTVSVDVPAGVTSKDDVMALVDDGFAAAGEDMADAYVDTVVFNDVPVGDDVKVITGLTLRDTTRDGVALTLPKTVVAQTDISVTTPDGTSTATTSPKVTGQINSAVLGLAAGKSWVTASGDQLSAMGSGEAATVTIKVANLSRSDVLSMSVDEPSTATTDDATLAEAANENTFNYEMITGAPTLTFPKGATQAQVTYVYGWGTNRVIGATQTINDGDSVAGPATVDDGLEVSGHQVDWADVYGVVITFTGSIVSCPLTPASGTPAAVAANFLSSYDDTCAAEIVIPTALRDTTLSGGSIPVPAADATTAITNIAHVSTHANDNTNGNFATASISSSNASSGDENILGVVIPEYQLNSSKAIGGSVVGYVLNGAAAPGDGYDTTVDPDQQTYSTHSLRLSGGSAYTGNTPTRTDLTYGPKYLVFSDPAGLQPNGAGIRTSETVTRAVTDVANSFWNDVRLVDLPVGANAPTVICAGLDYGATPTPTWTLPIGAAIDPDASYVLIADQAEGATSVTTMSLTDLATATGIDPAQIVGIVYSVVPTGAGVDRFPLNTQCTIDSGAVQFRDFEVVGDSIPVEPPADGATPGLLTETNSVDVRSDQAATSSSARYRNTSQAPMLLIDNDLGGGGGTGDGTFAGYKGYAPGAAQSGVEGQGQPTSFVLAGSSAGTNTKSINMTDGLGIGDGTSLDIFALTGITGAMMGPDQTMTIKLYDKNGNVMYTGTAGAPTPAGTDPDDALSPGFQAAEQTARNITWFVGNTAVGVPGGLSSVTDLDQVAQIGITVTRTTSGALLPEYSIARVTLNVALRDDTLTGTPPTPIIGGETPGTGQTYQNIAAIGTTDADDVTTSNDYPVDFIVYSPAVPLQGTAIIFWDAGSVGVLPAGDSGALSTITIAAYNDTAIDRGGHCPADTNPANVWACADGGRLDVGVTTLSASVGGAQSDETTQNPFALVNFEALTSITWPTTVHGGPVTATITYTYANGDTAYGTAVSTSSDLSDAQPPNDAAHPNSDIVGVLVTFDAGTDFITTHSESDAGTYSLATAQSAISFVTSLRTQVRNGYTSVFASGTPGTLNSGDGIDGPSGPDPQVTLAWVSWDATVVTPDHVADEHNSHWDVDHSTIGIVGQASGAAISKATTGGTGLFRDLLPSTAFTLTGSVTGNIPVDELRISDEGCLQDNATWPSTANPLGSTPTGCTVTPGSVYDAFNITSLTITKFPTTIGTGSPVGTLSATIWLLTADGWYRYSSADNGYYFDSGQTTPWTLTDAMLSGGVITKPSATAPDVQWADVIGWRMQIDGRNNVGYGPSARIVADVENVTGPAATQGDAVIQLDVKLREWTRLDSSVRSPDDDTTNGTLWNGEAWEVYNTADAATYMRTLNRTRTVDQVRSPVLLLPGDPSPVTDKEVVNDLGHQTKVAETSPGNWNVFMLTLSNTGDEATGPLVDPVLTDVLPANLIYNSLGGASHEWSVYSAPAHVTQAMIDNITFTYDTTAGILTWAMPHDLVLAVGESITLQVPLQMADGTPLDTILQNWVIGTGRGLVHDADNPTPCSDIDLTNPDPLSGAIPDVCKSESSVVALGDTGVRNEKYVANSTEDRGQITSSGTECDPSMMAPWDVVTGSEFWRDPCWVETLPGDVVTYRLKLINRGNSDLDELRFVDALPEVGDVGSLPPGARGSQFTPVFVPGSLHLVDDDTIEDPNFRNGASLEQSFWYNEDSQPCAGRDWASGASVLTCGDTWTADEPDNVGAIKGEVYFSEDAPLEGGQYVLVEFQMTVPANAGAGQIAVNDVAISGHSPNPDTGWLPGYLSTPVTIVARMAPQHHDNPPNNPNQPPTTRVAPTGGTLAGDDGLAGGVVALLMAVSGAVILIRRRK